MEKSHASMKFRHIALAKKLKSFALNHIVIVSVKN